MSADLTINNELLATFCDQDEHSLSELSEASPVLLIFLRHMG
ncbi:MAG TPA: hypothetical protein PKN33_04525 [Phycisphaerae bacterium]|nr:hypothetical protein [Phycisphaerae bacterium]